MSEQIRSIEVVVKVETNKRTYVHDMSAGSLDDALEQFRDEISDLRWSL